jgi:DNA-directed RNA polymerase subunit RPC12/RpoP
MSTAVACRPLSLLDQAVGGEPTLEEVLSGAWEGLTAHRPVECPVCAGRMKPRYGAHALPIGGACEDCGSKLS